MRQALAAFWTRVMHIVPAPVRRLGARMFAPLERWWGTLSGRERIHAYGLALLVVGFVAHFLCYAVFYIEDAGISIAYARNFVAGEGWVTYAGGERVEGFSNPLWTWLIGLWMLVGVSGWTSVKIMGAVFGAMCLPLSYLLARECRPDADDHVPMLPPVFLAASTTFAVWCASGLENGLFCVLMAAGAWRVLVESRKNEALAMPWSAVLFLGLAITRPEGIVYAAAAGLIRLLAAVRDRNVVKPIGLWLGVFFIPLAAYHAWRYDYFAWAFPNTYYAKMDGENRFRPWAWNTRGWKYAVNWASAFGIAYVAPLFAVGLVGLRDKRRWLVVLATVLGVVFLVWEGRSGVPADFDPDWLAYLQRHWDRTRTIFVLASVSLLTTALTPGTAVRRIGLSLIGVGVILLGMFGLPKDVMLYAVGLGGGLVFLATVAQTERTALAKLMVVLLASAGLFFVVYSGGDWMKQWRFFSYLAVPVFVLLGLGLGELLLLLPGGARRLGRVPLRGVYAVVLTALLIVPNLWQSIHAAPSPETSVSNVYQRVKYMTWVQERLHLERVTLFDVDMGAHMFYTDWRIVDVAGLVDVSMARHNYQKAFIREYVIQESAPDFAHQHGGWANKTKIKSHPEWKQDYIEIPGYATGRTALHIGNHVRKNIFVRPAYEGADYASVKLQRGVEVEGLEVVSPVVPQGGKLFVEYWLRAGYRKEGLRVYAVLDDGAGQRALTSLPPAYDWYDVDSWKASEHIRNRYDFDLSEDLGEGTYRLGLIVMDQATGQVLQAVSEDERFSDGVLWLDAPVEITSRALAEDAAVEDHDRAIELLAEGQCEAGLEAWRQARYHLWKDRRWRTQREDAVGTAAARCYVGRAEAAAEEESRIRWLVEARVHDHHDDAVLDASEPLAEELTLRGDALFDDRDWNGAYYAYADALKLDPTRAWTRRKAEIVRDVRLGIEGKVKDSAKKRKDALELQDKGEE
ncbi:MAG: hypothetical protein GY884_06930 [Proteobacteria bacterium]|nr:hypothetical protein [Pseudomonadota bacterium]